MTKKTLASVLLLLSIMIGFFVTSFLFELVLATLLFSMHFVRKDHFWERLGFSSALTCAIGFIVFAVCYFTRIWVIQNTLCYLLLFGVAMIVPFVCFDEQPITLFVSGVSGYMVQHIASQFMQILWHGQNINESTEDLKLMILFTLSRVVICGVVYSAAYVLIRRKGRTRLSPGVNRSLLVMGMATLLAVTMISGFRDAYAAESFMLMLASRQLSVLCCVLLLYLRWGILERGAMEQEREELLRLHAMQRSQYEQSKENIELINIKCHDLKHRVAQWERQGGQVSAEEIREVRDMIGIYDSSVKTGNETLDIILTERSLYCERQGIRLSCMVDGSKLSFMSTGDICALFGNALENAIEAVSRLENEEDRIISFQVRQKHGMLVVTVDNYFEGDLTFATDLPVTTKSDRGYHGFGMKSIRMVAEKYGGEVTVTADEMFHLTVLLPLPEQA